MHPKCTDFIAWCAREKGVTVALSAIRSSAIQKLATNYSSYLAEYLIAQVPAEGKKQAALYVAYDARRFAQNIPNIKVFAQLCGVGMQFLGSALHDQALAEQFGAGIGSRAEDFAAGLGHYSKNFAIGLCENIGYFAQGLAQNIEGFMKGLGKSAEFFGEGIQNYSGNFALGIHSHLPDFVKGTNRNIGPFLQGLGRYVEYFMLALGEKTEQFAHELNAFSLSLSLSLFVSQDLGSNLYYFARGLNARAFARGQAYHIQSFAHGAGQNIEVFCRGLDTRIGEFFEGMGIHCKYWFVALGGHAYHFAKGLAPHAAKLAQGLISAKTVQQFGESLAYSARDTDDFRKGPGKHALEFAEWLGSSLGIFLTGLGNQNKYFLGGI